VVARLQKIRRQHFKVAALVGDAELVYAASRPSVYTFACWHTHACLLAGIL